MTIVNCAKPREMLLYTRITNHANGMSSSRDKKRKMAQPCDDGIDVGILHRPAARPRAPRDDDLDSTATVGIFQSAPRPSRGVTRKESLVCKGWAEIIGDPVDENQVSGADPPVAKQQSQPAPVTAQASPTDPQPMQSQDHPPSATQQRLLDAHRLMDAWRNTFIERMDFVEFIRVKLA